MAAERLVSVSWFPTQQVADEESVKLQEAGLEFYIAGEYQQLNEPAEILVPESQVERARALLKIEPEVDNDPLLKVAAPQSHGFFLCPECRSADTYRVPAYALRVVVASVVLLAVTFIIGQAWMGAAGVVVGWVAAMWLSRRSGSYHCRSCGREWKPE